MNADWKSTIDAAVDATADQMVALRRHLHAHPEPSNEELETSLHLYQLFSGHGLNVRMGPEGRGVIVDGRNAPTNGKVQRIALRADIDALRIQDEKSVAYASQTPGIMHACGHDAHTATVFGALAALENLESAGALPESFAWRCIFQPAEETSSGARDMVEAGALDGVDAILALHVDPTRRTGVIGVRPGVFTASCDSVRLTIHGRGGHGARPHESNDPIAAAAQLISTLYQFVPRATDSQDAVVLSFGQIRGGENPNVIPEHVELWGTLRTLARQVRERTLEQVRNLVAGVEQITRTKIDVSFESSIPSVNNDSQLTTLVSRAVDELLGANQLEIMARPSMGSEDFAAYLERVPGAMFRLGCAGDSTPAPGLHTPKFDIDERCLPIGAKLLARSAVAWAMRETRDVK
jgi:amidohydrolase